MRGYAEEYQERCKGCRWFDGKCKNKEVKKRVTVGDCPYYESRWPEGLKKPEGWKNGRFESDDD